MTRVKLSSVTPRAAWERLVWRRFKFRPEDSACYWPVARIRRAIAAEFPRFRRARLRVIRRGHALAVEVGGRYIFKFAWHPLADLKVEIAMLKRLRGRLGVPIPDPVFVSRDARFFGYRKLPGDVLRHDRVDAMSPPARAALAASIADVCVRLQRAVPARGRARFLGREPRIETPREIARVARDFARIFRRSPDLVASSREVFAGYTRFCAGLSRGDLICVGFDLQFDNLLVDARGRLAGVLDWGFLTWQTPSTLFGLLAKDHAALTNETMRVFGRRMGLDVNPADALADGCYAVFAYLIEVSTNRWDMAARRREWLALARRLTAASPTPP